jgi:ABC-type taurine transport system substrate-binding protein
MRMARRTLLLGAGAISTAGAAGSVLRVGDQRGNQRAVMEAADVLRDLPYRIVWSEFPAAAPLLEAMNAGAIDAGVVGAAPFHSVLPPVCRCGSSRRAGLCNEDWRCWCVGSRPSTTLTI